MNQLLRSCRVSDRKTSAPRVRGRSGPRRCGSVWRRCWRRVHQRWTGRTRAWRRSCRCRSPRSARRQVGCGSTCGRPGGVFVDVVSEREVAGAGCCGAVDVADRLAVFADVEAVLDRLDQVAAAQYIGIGRRVGQVRRQVSVAIAALRSCEYACLGEQPTQVCVPGRRVCCAAEQAVRRRDGPAPHWRCARRCIPDLPSSPDRLVRGCA
jgi:hypothetical protein